MPANVPVSMPSLIDIFYKLNMKCPYGFGDKWNLNSAWRQLVGSRVDCSGFVRWILHAASNGKFTLVDGSQMQWQEVEKLGWRQLAKYGDLKYAATDKTRLFICFLKPVYVGTKLLKAGHVWLCTSQNGQMRTIESWGGKGVSSRPYNASVFILRHAVAYEVPLGD